MEIKSHLELERLLCILIQDSLIWSFSTKDSISSPNLLTLHLLTSLSAAWDLLVAVLSSFWFYVCVRPSALLLSANIQVASEIHGSAVLASRDGLLTIFFRSIKCESPYCNGSPFFATMDQMYRSLQYLQCLLAPYPLSFPSTIR